MHISCVPMRCFLIAEYPKSQLGKPASKSVDGQGFDPGKKPTFEAELTFAYIGALLSFYCLHKAAFILKRFATHMGEKGQTEICIHTYIHSYMLTLFVKPFRKNTCVHMTSSKVLQKEEGY